MHSKRLLTPLSVVCLATVTLAQEITGDASVYKNTHITERVNVQFRAEAFNVLN